MGENANRTAVITGASSGMGLVTARALAARGWDIIALGRDPVRSAAAEKEIAAVAAPQVRTEFIRVDLSLMADTEVAATAILNLTDRIDVLVNNAGGVASDRRVTPEGNEGTFAGNHLGHFLMTDRLLPLLRKAAADGLPGSTRVINVASSAHEATAGLDWNDLQSLTQFEPNAAYCRAKLANVLFSRELAKRLDADGIVVHAMHPGAVDTAFFSHGNDFMQEFGRTQPLVTVEDGADTIIWLATAAEAGASTGGYWYERKPIAVSDFARDDRMAHRLWIESEALLAKARASSG